MKIDVGGTPASVIRNNRIIKMEYNNLDTSTAVAILDPFDISREERKLELGSYKFKSIKFPIDIRGSIEDISSEKISAPSPNVCFQLFQNAKDNILGTIKSRYPNKIDLKTLNERYNLFQKKAMGLAAASKNLREFMNGLISLLCPNLKLITLEEVLSKNAEIVRNILKKTEVPVRAICPSCGRFNYILLGNNNSLCKNCQSLLNEKELINSGRYIPQQGFLTVITYLSGYLTFSNNKEKEERTSKIFKILGLDDYPLQNYTLPLNCLTMFESYLFDNKETLINNENLTKSSKEDAKT